MKKNIVAGVANTSETHEAERRSLRWGALLVLSATLGLSLKGIWARLAYAEGLSVEGVLFYRASFSAPLFLAGTIFLTRRQNKKEPARRQDQLFALGLGVLFAFGMFFDFQAIAQLGASISRVILFGFPLVVLLLEAFGTRTWPSQKRFIGFGLAWLGLASIAFFAAPHGGSDRFSLPPASLSTYSWAFASLGVYGLYVWGSTGVTRRLGSATMTGWSNLTTSFVVISVILVRQLGSAPPASQPALLWISAMVLISTVVPYFMLMEGIRRLGGASAGMLAMTGPLITLFAGWLFLGETLTPLQLLGTVLTLFGVRMAQRSS